MRRKSGRKPGGQPGHPGSTLALVEDPHRRQRHEPGPCTGCGPDLTGAPPPEFRAWGDTRASVPSRSWRIRSYGAGISPRMGGVRRAVQEAHESHEASAEPGFCRCVCRSCGPGGEFEDRKAGHPDTLRRRRLCVAEVTPPLNSICHRATAVMTVFDRSYTQTACRMRSGSRPRWQDLLNTHWGDQEVRMSWAPSAIPISRRRACGAGITTFISRGTTYKSSKQEADGD